MSAHDGDKSRFYRERNREMLGREQRKGLAGLSGRKLIGVSA
jgi:hypothetical protein